MTEKKKDNPFLRKKSKDLFKKSLLYEDELILILNKPYGIPVQGGTKINFSIDDILTQLSSDKKTFRLTHRLDKNTTGILIIAKSKEAAKNITKLFKEDNIKKTYLAIVIGEPKGLKGVIKSSIAKVNLNGIEKMKVVESNEKKAITYYKILETKKGLSLIEVLPKTGRTHQIRVHLLSKNCPILGDKKYSISNIKENKYYNLNYKMHLHAKSISFELNKKKYAFEAALPDHFVETLKNIKFKTLIKNNVKIVK